MKKVLLGVIYVLSLAKVGSSPQGIPQTPHQNNLIRLVLPDSVLIGEIAEVKIEILNSFKNESINVTVKLKVDNDLELIEKKNIEGSCIFTDLAYSEQQKSVTASTGSKAKISFYVRVSKVGNYYLTIQAEGVKEKGGKFYANGEKILEAKPNRIQVFDEHEKVFSYETIKHFRYALMRTNVKCEKITIELQTDTIARSIIYSDDYKSLSESTGEETAHKFSIVSAAYVHVNFIEKDYGKSMRVKKELDRLYYRMLSFFDIDGCYNQKNEEESWWDRLWGIERKVRGGVWLTSFASTLLGQAMNKEIIPENPKIIRKALRYLEKRKNEIYNDNQTFYVWKYFGNYEKLPCQGLKSAYWLTTNVMLTFITNKVRLGNEFEEIFNGGMKYIENNFNNFDACSMSAASFIYSFLDENSTLQKISKIRKREFNGKNFYLSENEIGSEVKSLISSYVALAFMKISRFNETRKILAWLADENNFEKYSIKKIDANIPLMAILGYAEKVTKFNSEYFVKIIDSEKNLNLNEATFDAENQRKFIKEYSTNTLQVKGHGSGILYVNNICEQFIEPKRILRDKNFNVSSYLFSDIGEIKICLEIPRNFNNESETMVVEVEMQNGFIFDENDNEFNRVFGRQKFLKNIEVQKGATLVILYVQNENEEDSSNQCVQISMRKNSTNISDLKDAYVKVYMKDNYDEIKVCPYNLDLQGCN